MSLTEATQAKVDIKHYVITDVLRVNFKVYLQETKNKLLCKYIIKLTPPQNSNIYKQNSIIVQYLNHLSVRNLL